MGDDILISKTIVQPVNSDKTPSSQYCVIDVTGKHQCLYFHEGVSLILAIAILFKALAIFIRAVRGDSAN